MFLYCANTFAHSSDKEIEFTTSDPNPNAAVNVRTKKESFVETNPFAITFYKQNYILPFYYTASPYNKVYVNQIPRGESIKNTELKYQISMKLPVWKQIFGSNNSLYLGYTQLSYWQAYNKNAFFRETDFQPELFITNPITVPLINDWAISAVNIGAVHESNGFGTDQEERSWNRIYLEVVASTEGWMLSIKPWYVFHDSAYQKFNPDMANYLGYGEFTVAYKYAKQVFTFQAHSLIEHGGNRATGLATYSFPLTTYLNGFVQVFSGYGQSLIEYNHRTNSIGAGIAFSNLI